MHQKDNIEKVEPMDILIGVTILVCLLLCHLANEFGIHIDALAVTTGAIMCVQDSTKAAYSASVTKMIGVAIGGLFGIGIALIDSAVGNPYVFYVLCSLGVVATVLVCKFFKMIYVQARVGGLSMLLVVMVLNGTDRLDYALNRFIGSLVGAVFAMVVTIVFSAIVRKFQKEE